MEKINPTIILVKPQLPENIGLVARAMDNCGLKKLFLINPREKWPNKKSIDSSANSKKIIKNVKIFENINNALCKFDYVIATSNRKRYLQKPFFNNFNECFNKVPLNKKIGIVFGPENSGLSNNDLMLCDSILKIKLSKSNTSLNLSHAVLLFSYQFRDYFFNLKNNNKEENINKNIAPKKDFYHFMKYLEKELIETNFLYSKHKKESMLNNIQTMLLRASLSKTEIQTLWGLVKNLRNSRQKRQI